jgi:hypothetical protein
MRAYLVVALLVACSNDSKPTPLTWGDAADELSRLYCEALEACSGSVDVPVCTEHTAWHLCEPYHTCSTELDPEAASQAIEDCAAALEQPTNTECVWLFYSGGLPKGCDGLLDMNPS